MRKTITFYFLLTFSLLFFAIFLPALPTLCFFLLMVFFILVIIEKFPEKKEKVAQIRTPGLTIAKNKVNKYYRRLIIYPWLSICFLASMSEMGKNVVAPTDVPAITEAKVKVPTVQKVSTIKKIDENKSLNSNKFTAKVLSNYDGDTLTVSINGKKEKIRLLGVDTAEIAQGYWGKQAKLFTEKLTKGKSAEVETDIQKRDKYGRLLGYVYVDGKFLNNELIKNGYAQLLTYSPNVRYVNMFTKSQAEARNKKVNIWSDNGLKQSPHDFRHKKTPVQKAKAAPIKKRIITEDAPLYLVHVNVKSGVYHAPHCRFYDCKNCVLELSSEEARRRGYRHCQRE